MIIERLDIAISDFNGAALTDAPEFETARILRKLADDIENGTLTTDGAVLRDINGNRVGFAEITFEA